jgi:hypothetical protein
MAQFFYFAQCHKTVPYRSLVTLLTTLFSVKILKNTAIRQILPFITHKNHWLLTGTFVVAVTMMTSQSLQAALTVSEIVAQFNGWSFTSSEFSYYEKAFTPTERGIDITAYAELTRSGNAFLSICANPNQPDVSGTSTASLYYDGSGLTSITGTISEAASGYLSVGAAFLYQQYATGVLPGFDYTNSTLPTQRLFDASALWHAMNHLSLGLSLQNNSQKFIDYLLSINSDMRHWTQAYNVNPRYNEMGDYAVFIMNLSGQQDRYYIAHADYTPTTPTEPPQSGDVPEPATLLLWTLGGLGVTGASWYRKRNVKKLALA